MVHVVADTPHWGLSVTIILGEIQVFCSLRRHTNYILCTCMEMKPVEETHSYASSTSI